MLRGPVADAVGSALAIARRRTLVFAAALLVLRYYARSGVGRATVQVVFVVFVVAATVWVRGQYADSLADNPAPLGWKLPLAICALGVVLVGVFVVTGRSAWTPAGGRRPVRRDAGQGAGEVSPRRG